MGYKMILEIMHLGTDDEILRQVAEPVDLDVEFEKTATLVRDMIETVKDKQGVGLAAPQVGVSKRVIVVKDPDKDEFIPMINPVINWTSFDKESNMEGCLSILGPDGNPLHEKVFRFTRVKVQYQTLSGQTQEILIKNHLFSRIVQHETDHLDGKLYVDYLNQ